MQDPSTLWGSGGRKNDSKISIVENKVNLSFGVRDGDFFGLRIKQGIQHFNQFSFVIIGLAFTLFEIVGCSLACSRASHFLACLLLFGS